MFPDTFDFIAQFSPRFDPSQTYHADTVKWALDLIKVSNALNRGEDFLSAERIQAIASLAGAVAWPLAAITISLIFRKPIVTFLPTVTEVEIWGAKVKRVERYLEEAASNTPAKNAAPTNDELRIAAEVEDVAAGNPSLIAKKVEALALEYDRERSSLPPGDERTWRLEVIVAQMRVLGKAAYTMRHDLSASHMPGKRLQAIACLQMKPDYDMLTWLAERTSAETPFVSYHALIALVEAARGPFASRNRFYLQRALKIVQAGKHPFKAGSDGGKALHELESLINETER